jgi:hypothetical protein
MIGVIFKFGNEIIEVRVEGVNCFFRNSQYMQFVPIEGLKLERKGVIKEFPDLENRDDWKTEAIKRFKERMEKLNSEDERMNYVINDLKKFGYIPLYQQKTGFRPKKLY